MSIHHKLILITILSFLFLLTTQNTFISSEMQDAFNQVEQRQATEAHNRLTSALEGKKKYIEFKLYDWAVWDETFDYLVGKNDAYIKKNIPDAQVFVKALQIDFAIIFDRKGKAKHYISKNEKENTTSKSISEEVASEIWKSISNQNANSLSGFINIAGQPILFTSLKILKGDGKGDSAGTFFAAENIDDEFSNRISEMISKKTFVRTIDAFQSEKPHIQMQENDLMTITATIFDLQKKPIAEISIQDNRDVNMTLLKSTKRMNIFLFAVLSLMFGIVSITVHQTVVKPLQEFINWQRSLTQSGSWTTSRFVVRNKRWPLLRTTSNQEIFDLSTSTNKMLDKIEEASQVIQKQTLVLINAEKIRGLGELSAGVAHEINNPLAVIFSHLTLISRLLETPKIDRQKLSTSVSKIESMGQRIRKIVSGLITFSRDGNNDPFISGLLHTPIADAIELIFERVRSNNIALTCQFDESIEVNYRPGQISQIVLNLLGNSIDAIAKEENKWIKIETYKHLDSAFFKITDSGNGIPIEIRNKIMQPFFTTKDVGKGTGLGLSISLGLIQEHKGTISVDHECAHTCFIIQLPLSNYSNLKSQEPHKTNSKKIS